VTRLLVVEDEETIAVGLHDGLELEGYSVEVAREGLAATERALHGGFDLVLLDVMLPGKDGFTLCREWREAGLRTPIILLTAKTQEVDKVVGLELGADDYVTKPFSLRELVARIRAVLRRASAARMEPSPGPVYEFGDVRVDFGRCEAWRKGKPIQLTALELKLLGVLLAHRGQVLPMDQLLSEVWGRDVFLSDGVVYTHVNNLRAKLEDDPAKPRLLVSVRGVGYRFDG
jgi:DNA-binding response OmpR family regulator